MEEYEIVRKKLIGEHCETTEDGKPKTKEVIQIVDGNPQTLSTVMLRDEVAFQNAFNELEKTETEFHGKTVGDNELDCQLKSSWLVDLDWLVVESDGLAVKK